MTPHRNSKYLLPLILLFTFISIGTSGCGGVQDLSDATDPNLGRGRPECEVPPAPGRNDSSLQPETILLNPGPSNVDGDTPVDGLAKAHYWKPQADLNSSRAGVVFVSGVDGGFIEPADEIYTRISQRLASLGVPSIFVRYREPGVLEPSVDDALAAAGHLRQLGVTRMALAGWSFGGAVITQSAVRIPEAVTIVGFAPQAKDTEAVQNFNATQSILLFHSYEDENVPFISSEQILDEAPEGIKKQFVKLESSNHILDGEGEKLTPIVLKWLETELRVGMGTEGGMAHCFIPQT